MINSKAFFVKSAPKVEMIFISENNHNTSDIQAYFDSFENPLELGRFKTSIKNHPLGAYYAIKMLNELGVKIQELEYQVKYVEDLSFMNYVKWMEKYPDIRFDTDLTDLEFIDIAKTKVSKKICDYLNKLVKTCKEQELLDYIRQEYIKKTKTKVVKTQKDIYFYNSITGKLSYIEFKAGRVNLFIEDYYKEDVLYKYSFCKTPDGSVLGYINDNLFVPTKIKIDNFLVFKQQSILVSEIGESYSKDIFVTNENEYESGEYRPDYDDNYDEKYNDKITGEDIHIGFGYTYAQISNAYKNINKISIKYHPNMIENRIIVKDVINVSFDIFEKSIEKIVNTFEVHPNNELTKTLQQYKLEDKKLLVKIKNGKLLSDSINCLGDKIESGFEQLSEATLYAGWLSGQAGKDSHDGGGAALVG